MSYIGNSPGNASQRVVTRKVATAGQTRFASDSGYATGYVDVIVNGADLVAGEDFNETGDGINIDLVEACAADDSVKIIAWIPRGLSDGYTKPEANALLALKADLVAGKIPSSQLPAYVDDVLEYANLAAFPATGSAGIIYVAQDTNNCYRWSGSAYILITDLSAYARLDGAVFTGGISVPNSKIYTFGAVSEICHHLTASGTQAKRYEVARVAIDTVNWNDVGTIEIEMREKYFDAGTYKKYIVNFGYASGNKLYMTDAFGRRLDQFKVSIGSAVLISGNQYYYPVYVDVRNYGQVDVTIKTNNLVSGTNPPSIGYAYLFTSPTVTDIADFTTDYLATTMAEQAPWCYARAQYGGGDTIICIDPQYKQSILYYRSYANKVSDTATYFNGYLALQTAPNGTAYPNSGTAESAVEWNGWLMSRGAGTSPAFTANQVANTRWNQYLPQADYGQDISGSIIINQPWSGNRGSVIYDVNYTKSQIGSVRSTGSGQKTSAVDPIYGVQFNWDVGGTGSNPDIHIDYYIVGVK